MVLDSPFASLAQLANELVDKARERGSPVPKWVVGLVIRMLRSSVQAKAGFDLYEAAWTLCGPCVDCVLTACTAWTVDLLRAAHVWHDAAPCSATS